MDELTHTERAVLGHLTPQQARGLLDDWVRRRLGSGIAEVRFRAGRIDVVWGVSLEDGRAVVVKAHRTPTDLDALAAATDARWVLSDAGFPCAEPLAGPEVVDGDRVLSAESLLPRQSADGRDPSVCRVLAHGLRWHVELLRDRPDLVGRVGPGPSWCRYADGPWPAPHDPVVDLATPVAGYGWVDELGGRAAAQVVEHRDPTAVVVGHADWYVGNVSVVDGRLVASYDWELVADTEAVIAGFAAACFAASASGGGGLSDPDEARAFLQDYEDERGCAFDAREVRAAAGAAAWIVAFNARWQVGLIPLGIADRSTLALARERGEEYSALSW